MIKISIFSGKCDVFDTIVRDTDEETLEEIKKTKFFACDNILVPLRIDTVKDLVPYYSHLVAMGFYNKDNNSVYLSKESFIDSEERESLEWYQKECIKYVKKCKRKKEVIDMDHFTKMEYEFPHVKEIKTEILKRISERDMSLDGLYLPLSDYYRKNLYDEMIRVGWSEYQAWSWVYKWRKREDHE